MMKESPPQYENVVEPTQLPTYTLEEQEQQPTTITIPSPVDTKQPILTSRSNSRPTTQPRFPREFGIYHTGGALSSDRTIALHVNDPNPLFYVETHSGLGSKASIILHSTALSTSPTLATVSFRCLSSSSDIVLLSPECLSKTAVNYAGNPDPQSYRLRPYGAFCQIMYFKYMVDGKEERFEWKRSSGEEVESLGGGYHGRKLVRASDGRVVAVWVLPGAGLRKKGNMAFVGARLGDGFELLTVMSILAIMGADRRAGYGPGGAAV